MTSLWLSLAMSECFHSSLISCYINAVLQLRFKKKILKYKYLSKLSTVWKTYDIQCINLWNTLYEVDLNVILFCSANQHPAGPSTFCRRRSAPDYSVNRHGRPGWRQHSRTPITHILYLLSVLHFYYSLSFWVETRVTDPTAKGRRETWERGDYLEVNNRNSKIVALRVSCSLMKVLKRWR